MKGIELKEIRNFFNLTQKELGELTKLTNRTIFNYEQMEDLPAGKSQFFESFFKAYSNLTGNYIDTNDESKYSKTILKYLYTTQEERERATVEIMRQRNLPLEEIEKFRKTLPAEMVIAYSKKENEVPGHTISNLSNHENGSYFVDLPNGQFFIVMPLAEINTQAGLLDRWQDQDYINELTKYSLITEEPLKGRNIAFRVKGDSMDDGTSNAITPNSIVATRELPQELWDKPIRHKEFPYWIIYTTQGKAPLLKEITKHDISAGVITCHSLNESPEYNDFELSIKDIQALFYVIAVSKEMPKKSYV